MKQFDGFPARMNFTPIPNLFFSRLLPQITDIAELKTTLQIFRLLYPRKGYPRFVSVKELLSDRELVEGLKNPDESTGDAIRRGLELAVKRGTIIHLTVEKSGTPEEIYLLNTETDRRAAEKIRNGELVLAGLKAAGTTVEAAETANIYVLYEENVGLLTPMIAEELKEAEDLYPAEWITEAFREAVSLNKRNWRYISKILENWSAEGREHGTHRGDTKKGPDRYSGQKYGDIIKR